MFYLHSATSVCSTHEPGHNCTGCPGLCDTSFYVCLPCNCLLNLLLLFFIYSAQNRFQKGKMKWNVLSNLTRRRQERHYQLWSLRKVPWTTVRSEDVRTSLLISSTSLSMRKNLAIFSEGPCSSLCSKGTSPLLNCFFSGIYKQWHETWNIPQGLYHLQSSAFFPDTDPILA